MRCRYSNNTGVEIRPYKFGGLEGVAALDPQLPDSTATYAAMIQVSRSEYTSGFMRDSCHRITP